MDALGQRGDVVQRVVGANRQFARTTTAAGAGAAGAERHRRVGGHRKAERARIEAHKQLLRAERQGAAHRRAHCVTKRRHTIGGLHKRASLARHALDASSHSRACRARF